MRRPSAAVIFLSRAENRQQASSYKKPARNRTGAATVEAHEEQNATLSHPRLSATLQMHQQQRDGGWGHA